MYQSTHCNHILSLHDALPIWLGWASSGPSTSAPRSWMKVRSPVRMRVGSPLAKAAPVAAEIVPSMPARPRCAAVSGSRSEEHTSELQSRGQLVCRLLLEKKNK